MRRVFFRPIPPFFKPLPMHTGHTTKAMQRKVLSSVSLSETEQQIKSVLIDFCAHYNQKAGSDLPGGDSHNGENDTKLELRITGGWVRDKLLGGDSNDVDIAINVLSGEEFATQLMQWAQSTSRFMGTSGHGLHTIKKNPDKSKHLETCTTKLFGLDVDFVNLRSEEYTTESRVPVVEYGTPQEDAMRRDATLNALFYNINQDKIEDFTGRGLTDLRAGILRTPLPPLQTFLDDPLRVLRLIRFACRFDFEIDPETLDAMKNPEVKDALVHKISRERVGVELHKILVCGNVPYGLRLINHVNLGDCIFDAGTQSAAILQVNEKSVCDELDLAREQVNKIVDEATQHFPAFLHAASAFPQLGAVVLRVFSSPLSQKLFWLAVILHPYGTVNVKIHAKKLSSANYVEVIIKEGLRFGKLEYDTATLIARGIALNDFLAQYFALPSEAKRSDIGLYIRQFNEHFDVNLVANAFVDYLANIETSELRTEVLPSPEHADSASAKSALVHYEQLLHSIDALELSNVKDVKPIIDGKLISKELQRKPGPWMRDIALEVMRWQLDNPHGSAQECMAYIRDMATGLN